MLGYNALEPTAVTEKYMVRNSSTQNKPIMAGIVRLTRGRAKNSDTADDFISDGGW
jgi:hypothetical protein